MKRYSIGDVYAAKCFDGDTEIKGKGYYHFKVIDIAYDYLGKPIFAICIKLDMDDYSEADLHTCSFDLSGISTNDVKFTRTSFVLTRKLKHKKNHQLKHCDFERWLAKVQA